MIHVHPRKHPGTAAFCLLGAVTALLAACSSQPNNTAKTPATVTVTVQGTGQVVSFPSGISCGSTCTGTFFVGDTIALVAEPASGFELSSWSGATCTGALCQLTLTGNTSVTATFGSTTPQPKSAKVTVTVQGAGQVVSFPAGIMCGSTCTGTFSVGDVIALVAEPATGNALSSWSGASCSGTLCQVTLTGDTALTATFASTAVEPKPAKVSVTVQGSGKVTSYPAGIDCGGTCSSTFSVGDTVALVAQADSGSVFSGWSNADCTGSLCGLTLSGDTTVTATFTTPTFAELSVSVVGTGLGTVTSDDGGINCPGSACVSQVATGNTVTLTATPTEGYFFAGWIGGGTCSGKTPTCTVPASEAMLQAKAAFTAIPFVSDTSLDGFGKQAGPVNLWLTSADGTELHPISLFPKSGLVDGNGDPASFSADGTVAVLASQTAVDGSDTWAGISNVWLLDALQAKATPITRLTTAVAYLPHLMPDASKLFYVSSRDPSSTTEAVLANGATRIWQSSLDGSTSAPLTTSVDPARYSDLEISPDGSMLAVLANQLDSSGNGGPTNLWVMAADGSSAVELTHLTTRATFSPVAWAPDGQRLAYISSQSTADPTMVQSNALNVWIADLHTHKVAALTSFTSSSAFYQSPPAWSPAGGLIAFCLNVNADGSSSTNINVLTVDASSGHLTALSTMLDSQFSPMWAPDGSLVFFTGTTNGVSNLWKVDRQGASAPAQVTSFSQGTTGTPTTSYD